VAIETTSRNPIVRALNFLAKMGLTVRDDPPKTIDVAARTWGEALDGFALSVEQIPQEDAGAPPSLSVVLRNVSAAPQTLTVPGWLAFYRMEMDAERSAFGRELLKPERHRERVTVTLAPGQPVDTQIPIGSLFVLKRGAEYRVQVSCTLPGGSVLTSNSVAIRV
jgi:hypothetical protein